MKKIAITVGEPAGIGPDICLELASNYYRQDAELIFIVDPELLQQRAKLLNVSVPKNILVEEVKLQQSIVPGKLNPANAKYVLESIKIAVDGAMSGKYDAVVTGPVHKGVINEAGINFTGHTEYLASLSNSEQVVMMLTTEQTTPTLRVALVTTHLPLSKVVQAISKERVERVARILYATLQREFKISEPTILVCGLNPHAGENGYLGIEEQEIIDPVLEKLREENMDFIGSLPADTLFTTSNLERADAVLAMYHDQGLPVLKHVGFGKAVNITLGLPFIRTSVDHGTALELAGSGDACANSLYAAVEQAIELSTPQFPSYGGVARGGRDSKNYFNLPYNPPNLKQKAKELRKAGNLSEVLFWQGVKNKQFKGLDFDRQKIIGNYIVDFYCANCQVVIEIDGESHNGKWEYDTKRDEYLKSLGLTVIHVDDLDIKKNLSEVMEMLDNHPALADTPPKEGN